MARYLIILFAVVVTTSVAASQPKDGRPADLETASPFDVAVLLARSELSAGMVIRLPEHMEAALAGAVQRLSPDDRVGADAFRTLVRGSRRGARLIPVEPGRSGHDVIRSYATAHRGEFAASQGFRDVPLLKQARTGVCASVLGRPVRERHASQYPDELVSAVINDATGAPIPPGAVGSCLPRFMTVSPQVIVEPTTTLEDALSAIAAQVSGAVWMAIESADGHCALGLVRTSENPQDACTVGLANISRLR